MNSIKKIILSICMLILFINVGLGQNVHKNGISLEIGYGGGDGVFPTYLYGIEYAKALSGRFDVYVEYMQSKGTENNFRAVLEDRFVIEENESEFQKFKFVQFSSVGLGMKKKVVKIDRACLFLLLGARYINSKSTEAPSLMFVSGDIVNITEFATYQESGIAYEFGIGYSRIFKEKFTIGGTVNYINFDSRIAASFNIGVLF